MGVLLLLLTQQNLFWNPAMWTLEVRSNFLMVAFNFLWAGPTHSNWMGTLRMDLPCIATWSPMGGGGEPKGCPMRSTVLPADLLSVSGCCYGRQISLPQYALQYKRNQLLAGSTRAMARDQIGDVCWREPMIAGFKRVGHAVSRHCPGAGRLPLE